MDLNDFGVFFRQDQWWSPKNRSFGQLRVESIIDHEWLLRRQPLLHWMAFNMTPSWVWVLCRFCSLFIKELGDHSEVACDHPVMLAIIPASSQLAWQYFLGSSWHNLELLQRMIPRLDANRSWNRPLYCFLFFGLLHVRLIGSSFTAWLAATTSMLALLHADAESITPNICPFLQHLSVPKRDWPGLTLFKPSLTEHRID